MTELITHIDAYSLENFGYLNSKFWGFCELSYRSSKDSKGNIQGSTSTTPIVMTIPSSPVPNGQRQQVTLDDQYDFITWVRWIEPARGEIDDLFSYGREEAEKQVLPLRIIVAHKCLLGEDIVFSFAKGLPKQIINDGFKYIFMEGRPAVNPDHENIYRTELGDTVYEKHRFTWNVYAVDVAYGFMICEETTP
jgi:hypothetical protein